MLPLITVILSLAIFNTEAAPQHAPPHLTVINGDEATPHEAPFAVALLITNEDLSGSKCTGSLISSKYVLTARHCLRDAQSVTVIAGAHNISVKEPEQVRVPYINDFKFHPNPTYDIALIELYEEIAETDNIKYSQLPVQQDENKSYDGQKPIVYGWGRTGDAPVTSSKVLRKLELVVYDAMNYRDYEIHTYDGYSRTPKSTCSGDSGGPLVLNGVQIGVTSHSPKPCTTSWHSYFFKVAKAADWIRSTARL